jgi:hypothetical protein
MVSKLRKNCALFDLITPVFPRKTADWTKIGRAGTRNALYSFVGRLGTIRATTLVETLVSTGILALVIGGLLYAAVAAKYLINASGNRMEIWNLITSRHEEVSDWSEAYVNSLMTTNPWTNIETSTNLLQQGLLNDNPLRHAIINRTTVITRNSNLYTVVISVSYRQSHMGSPTTNLQETSTIYFTPRY